MGKQKARKQKILIQSAAKQKHERESVYHAQRLFKSAEVALAQEATAKVPLMLAASEETLHALYEKGDLAARFVQGLHQVMNGEDKQGHEQGRRFIKTAALSGVTQAEFYFALCLLQNAAEGGHLLSQKLVTIIDKELEAGASPFALDEGRPTLPQQKPLPKGPTILEKLTP